MSLILCHRSPAFEDLAHHDALEAAGLLGLFLPTKPFRREDSSVKLPPQRWSDFEGTWMRLWWGGSIPPQSPPLPWNEWVEEWMHLWAAVPNCKYWDTQWAGLITRVIKHVAPADVDWEPHLPFLFTQLFNSVEVRDRRLNRYTCGRSSKRGDEPPVLQVVIVRNFDNGRMCMFTSLAAWKKVQGCVNPAPRCVLSLTGRMYLMGKS